MQRPSGSVADTLLARNRVQAEQCLGGGREDQRVGEERLIPVPRCRPDAAEGAIVAATTKRLEASWEAIIAVP